MAITPPNFLRLLTQLTFMLLGSIGLVCMPKIAIGQSDDDIVREPLVQDYFKRLRKETEYCNSDTLLLVSIARQEMYVLKGSITIKRYSISSSKKGIGCQLGSGQTPEGIHRVWRKIGHKGKIPYIFMFQKNTKRRAKIVTEPRPAKRDFVTSRILWLRGEENGFNNGGIVDSYKRNIYIHGTTDEGLIGAEASSGCLRMLNKDVIELYTLVPRLTYVVILNDVRIPQPPPLPPCKD